MLNLPDLSRKYMTKIQLLTWFVEKISPQEKAILFSFSFPSWRLYHENQSKNPGYSLCFVSGSFPHVFSAVFSLWEDLYFFKKQESTQEVASFSFLHGFCKCKWLGSWSHGRSRKSNGNKSTKSTAKCFKSYPELISLTDVV